MYFLTSFYIAEIFLAFLPPPLALLANFFFKIALALV